MAMAPASLAHHAPATLFAYLRELIRSMPRHVRLALGTRGVVLASVAGLIGLICCLVAFVDVALALRSAEVRAQVRAANEMHELDQGTRHVMRALHQVHYGRLPAVEASTLLTSAWRRFETSLASDCGQGALAPADDDRRRGVCNAARAMRDLLSPEVAAVASPGRPIDEAVIVQALALHGRFNQMRMAMAGDAELLVERLTAKYATSLAILTLCTVGFAGAGLMLILLVGRTSMQHHEQWKQASEARELLQQTIEALPVGVALFDGQERLMMFNSAAAAINPGLSRPGVIGMAYTDLAYEDARRIEAGGLNLPDPPEKWIERFRTKNVRHVRQMPDGRWIEWSERGGPNGGTVSLKLDVTEQKMHELELERSRAEYRDLVDSLSDMVYKIDVGSGGFTFVSAASTDLLGVPPDKLLGQRATSFVAPDDLEFVIGQIAAHLRKPDGTICHLQYRVRLPDGRDKYIETRFRKVRGENGKAIIAGVARDIDERVQMAERLEVELARLRSIIGSSGAMILVTDRAFNITMINSEFTAVTGVDEATAVGRPLKEVVNCPLDPAIVEEWLGGPLPSGRAEPARFTNRVWDPQGRERIIAVTVTPSVDARGQVEGFVFLGVDDTDRRAAEEALFDTERLATMGEMASTLAHEIAQPLQVINIAASAMQDEFDETAESARMLDREYLSSRTQRIAAQVERASRIIGEVRAFVRGTAQDQVAPFDIAVAVRGALDLTSHAAKKAGLAVSVTLVDGLPGVMGHVGRLEQVLINLINNARDAGARAVTVRAGTSKEDGRSFVHITVDDDGPGIAADVLPRLFQAFITTKPRGLGTGFGLRICRRIVEEMGGTISAGNAPTGGARFEIVLPAAAL